MHIYTYSDTYIHLFTDSLNSALIFPSNYYYRIISSFDIFNYQNFKNGGNSYYFSKTNCTLKTRQIYRPNRQIPNRLSGLTQKNAFLPLKIKATT